MEGTYLFMQNRTLTISGYEWRLKKYFREFYKAGARYSLKVSLFKDIWDLDHIGYGRVCKAFERLCKKGILIRPVVDGKEIRGSYKWNPDYQKGKKSNQG
jgi:hypothetical protein